MFQFQTARQPAGFGAITMLQTILPRHEPGCYYSGNDRNYSNTDSYIGYR